MIFSSIYYFCIGESQNHFCFMVSIYMFCPPARGAFFFSFGSVCFLQGNFGEEINLSGYTNSYIMKRLIAQCILCSPNGQKQLLACFIIHISYLSTRMSIKIYFKGYENASHWSLPTICFAFFFCF